MVTRDDETQARIAMATVENADEAMMPLPCVVELVWVLRAVYRFSRAEVLHALRVLLRMPNITTDVFAIDLGLQNYEAGGDFADGVIAAAGMAMGGEKFVSFDRDAVGLLRRLGLPTELLGGSAA